MAKGQQTKQNSPPLKKPTPSIPVASENKDFFESFDSFINKRKSILFYIFLGSCLLGSFFLFDVKLSMGLDDSNYIIRAYDFISQNKFPTFQGALYPLFLSVFVKFAGINVPFLKSLSVIFMLANVFVFYQTFKNKIQGTILFFTMLVVSFNSFILYYASMTYTEALYLLMQSLTLAVFFRLIDKSNDTLADIKQNSKLWALLGSMLLLTVLTRSVGFGLIAGLMGYFLLNRKWFAMGLVPISFAVFYLPYELLRKSIWQAKGLQASEQGKVFMYKDPYDYSLGTDDVWGFIERFFNNSDIYLSKHLMRILNLRPEESIEQSGGLSYFIWFLVLAALAYSFKKNKYILATGCVTLATLFISFIVLQTKWDSDRMVIIAVPYLALLLLYTFYRFFKMSALSVVQPFIIILLCVISFLMISNTTSKMSKNYKALKKNLSGDKYYGYTDDWRNLNLMSEWCADSLPKSAYVMSRKASMSFIYSNGRKFFEVYRVPSMDADTLLTILRDNKVTHILHASLRRNPAINDGQIITTTYNYLGVILQKYPDKFELVHEIGDSEPAYLYKLKE